MKTTRTKCQEVVNELYGLGVYRVREEDIDPLTAHFENVFGDLLDPDYIEAMLKYLRGDDMEPMDKQRKFHALQNLKVAIEIHPEAYPDFLPVVEYPDQLWSLADLAEVLYGMRGDPKVYHLDLPAPEEGRRYNTEEVRDIVKLLNT